MQSARKNRLLRRQREWRQMTQAELAEKIGTSEVNISRWENGTTFPGPYYRRKLCEFFGMSPEELGLAPANEAQQRSNGSSLPPIWNVSYQRNALFTGREDLLQRLASLLQTHEAIVPALALCGLGGVGKTQAAVEYAYRYRQKYQAVLWVRADSRETIFSDFIAIAHLLALPEKDEQDQNRIIDAVKRWLGQQSDWLLIFDNADDVQIANDFIVPSGHGHILLTTQTRNTEPIAQSIEITKLEIEDSIRFLLRRAGLLRLEMPLESIAQAERTCAQKLAELLDGLPLALDQAGAYIQVTGCGVCGYLDRYQRRGLTLLGTRDISQKSDHRDSVAATLALSFARLKLLNPGAMELLQLCAFMPPDAIPEEIFTEGASELGSVLEPIAADLIKLDFAIGDLRRFSLIDRDADSQTLTLHRLVQVMLKHQMDQETQKLWARRVITALNAAFPHPEHHNWRRCERLLPQVLLAAQYIEPYQITSEEAAHLLSETAVYLRDRSRYSEAESLFKRALQIYELQLGPEHLEVATVLSNLASLYMYQGKYDLVEPLCKRALQTYRQQPEHSTGDIPLHILATLYISLGKYEQAEPVLLQALEIRMRRLGPEHLDVATSLNNLASLYTHQGKYEQAESFYQQARRIYEQQEHPYLAYLLSNLAEIYVNQGNYSEAEKLYQRSRQICEQQLGLEHHGTAYPLNGLAELYLKQGDYTKAEPLFRQALQILEHQLGMEHPDIAYPLNGLANLYREQRKYADAEMFYQRALRVREQTLGPEHPDTAETMDALAQFWDEKGKSEEARTWYMRALRVREQALGAHHPKTTQTRRRLIALLHTIGEHEEAAKLEVVNCGEEKPVPHPLG
jgi:tetratricopeptide (TPR) repeat protein/DNA-binding XRE family transcriptional regulator